LIRVIKDNTPEGPEKAKKLQELLNKHYQCLSLYTKGLLIEVIIDNTPFPERAKKAEELLKKRNELGFDSDTKYSLIRHIIYNTPEGGERAQKAGELLHRRDDLKFRSAICNSLAKTIVDNCSEKLSDLSKINKFAIQSELKLQNSETLNPGAEWGIEILKNRDFELEKQFTARKLLEIGEKIGMTYETRNYLQDIIDKRVQYSREDMNQLFKKETKDFQDFLNSQGQAQEQGNLKEMQKS